jgi:FtsZ-interacting cell division protein ZipA
MEFVVILLLVIVAIFQIIILTNQQKNAKLIRELATSRQKHHHSDHNRDRYRDRKDNNHRQNRRNQQDGRQRQSSNAQSTQPSGAIDNVEKSLRDINLKLKNAERDQEAARRRISDPSGKEGSGSGGSRRHRNDGNRGGRRDRNNRNNNRGRNNNPDRSTDTRQNNAPVQHPANEGNASQETRPAAEVTPVNTLPNLNPVDFEPELEHGRTVQVKRRLLKEDLPGATNSAPGEVSEKSDSSAGDAANFEPTVQPETSTDEISFGRR